jgi:AraC-like DNA-binding protein
VQILTTRVQESLRESCERGKYVNLAVDGWSDPRGRRYQGVTIRFVKGIGATPNALLAIKEVKSIYECAAELGAMVRYFQGQFRITEKTLNSYSDRCSMSVRAFRRDKRELSTVCGEFGYPVYART